MNKLSFRLLLAALFFSLCVNAQPLRLAHVFSDHAVLQQDAQLPVWGWGRPGQPVKVTLGGQTVQTRVQSDGTWRAVLRTWKADGKKYTLAVQSGRDNLRVNDVVLGEVWLCSGQSNMEMPVSGFGFQEVEGGTDAIMDAVETAQALRVFNIKTGKCTEPQADVETTWAYSTPEITAWTSAVAYFFGKRLTKALGVPVGIIVNAWGGSRIEPWMTREAINGAGLTQEELDAVYAVQEKEDSWPETPELIWNGRVKPVAGYAARGIIWYQGCSNMNQNHCYDKLQKAMVELWRKEWNASLPFIFTLLAPYEHGDANGRWRPAFVENQLHTEEILDQSWAVCTETLGSLTTIHPAKKREVADMMVQRALQNVYGINPGVSLELPRLKEVVYGEDGLVKVTLTQVWSNLMSISARDIVGFELAGEDRVFHLAEAQVDWNGETILVRCPDVPHPVAVRYGWRNWMGANLQKSNGIPVPPFRSDDW